jgi:CDP-diacylglycerol--serine O-phosphatidyltransferase
VKKIAALPTILTLGNGFSGFMSLWYSSRALVGFTTAFASAAAGDAAILDAKRHFFYNMEMAGWMVLLAMIFDALDGKVARLVKAESDFGAQLDSLADVISFGVAPAVLILVASAEVRLQGSLVLARLGWAAASIFLLCVMMRLARFNVESPHDSEGTMYFAGLPSPAGGGFVASLVVMRYQIAWMAVTNREIEEVYGGVAGRLEPFMVPLGTYLPILAVLLAVLMVSRVRYIHVLNKLLGDQEAFFYVVLVVIGAFFFFFTRLFSIPLAFLIYIVWGLVGGFRSSLRDKKAANGEPSG